MFLFKRRGFYYLEYFDEVENRKKRVSTKSRLKPDALKFLIEFKEKLSTRNKTKYISLKEFKEEYCNFLEKTHTKSYLADVETTFNFLLPFFDNLPLAKLNTRLLEKFLLDTFNKTKYGAKHHYNNLRAAFNKAIFWGYLEENPLKKFRLPKIPQSFPAFINSIELNSIIEKTKNDDLKDFFLMGYHSGMRRDEIRLLKWSSINLKDRIIIVSNSTTFTTKSKKERVIPINDTLFNMLKNRLPKIININGDEYIFQKCQGIPFHPDYVTKQFKKVVRDLGMNEKIHLHSLRHSTASNMAQANVSLYIIKEILGHQDISTTAQYSHLQKENLTTAIKVLDQAV
jgi:integrase